jgi:hypothetical protein
MHTALFAAAAQVAIFKPCDEEPLALNNPKGYVGRNMGEPGWKVLFRHWGHFKLVFRLFWLRTGRSLSLALHSSCPSSGWQRMAAGNNQSRVHQNAFMPFILLMSHVSSGLAVGHPAICPALCLA